MVISEIINKTDSSSWEIKKRAIELECELLNNLEKDDVKTLNEMVDAYLEYANKAEEVAYTDGICIGVRLMLRALSKAV